MMRRRASYLGFVGIILTLWALANGCSLDTTGFGETEDVCTVDAHCDDANVCTADTCGPSGVCVHTPVADGQYPDGVNGNCKVFECKAGTQSEVAFDDDASDNDECTADKCVDGTPTHTKQAGAVCHSGGGIGVCTAEGKCSIECGGVDANGEEIGCPPSDDACSVSYCDKAQGKCVLDALDGIAKPGTTPGDCGGTYCVKGKSAEVFATLGTACSGTTPGGNPAIVCDDAGKCVGCNAAADCDPNGYGTSFCFTATCNAGECSVTSQPDGTVLPAGQQITGDCQLKQCLANKVISVPLDSDINDDMNLCTIDLCVNGVEVVPHPPTPINSACGANGTLFCDGAGTCQNCTVAAQCGTNTDCHQFACNSGTCADIYPPVDTPVSVAGQTPGDCLLQVCDGAGGIKPNQDNGDLPNDSNDCTLDQCSNGTAVFPPVGVGSVCLTNRICDATGNCLGNTCVGANDCPATAFCVDGVCCNAACSTVCGACTNLLKGTGLNGDCGISAAGTDNGDTDCPGAKVCDGTLGAGACKLPVGQPCSVSGECLIGNCVDGYCCNNACAGTCQVCNAAGAQGTCTNIPFGQDPANECAGAVNCNGTGACGNLFGNGTACAQGVECQSGFCTDGVCCSAQCNGNCQSCVLAMNVGTCLNIPVEQDPANECAGATVCNGAGLCKTPKGAACAVAGDCASGFCADGVCCDAACGATCKACNLAGLVGTCSNIVSGQDPAAECPGATSCNGNGACALFSNGTGCSIGMECTSGNCVDGVCCNSTCVGACKACNLAGSNGTCTNIPNLQDPANECTGAQVCNGMAACVGGSNGAACAANNECASMQCIDGVCCNTSCSGVCQACNVSGSIGTCSSVPNATDPANECPGATNCNGSGACALLANGVACSLGTECTSGNCVDGVCCNSACGALCQACNVVGLAGTCSNIVAGQDPANECANGACSGGGCKLDNGQVCAAGTACLSGNCIDGVCCNTACGALCLACNVAGSVGTCSSIPNGTDPANECSGTTSCNGAGACGLLANGTACGANVECTSGNCIDGVCCNTTCGGSCQACNVAGSLGACTSIPTGTDPANECANGACNGAGACKLNNGQVCAAGSACLSTNCIDGLCCNTTCGGTCQACNVAGSLGTCSSVPNGTDPANECSGATSCNGAGACALFANGAACSLGTECTSGNCIDGFCCNTTCGGACQACNVAGLQGTCSSVPTGTDPANECPGMTSCNGAGACALFANGTGCTLGTECSSGECVDGVCCITNACSTCKTCNGSMPGTCTNIAVDTIDNNPVNACAGVSSCDGAGTCRKNDGQLCPGGNGDCVHGHCVDGYCCDTACSGTCEACSNALTGMANGTCANIPVNTDPANECTGSEVCSMLGTCVTAPNGLACAANGADAGCASGQCADLVCCDNGCSGLCKACTAVKKGAGADGTCGFIAATTDPDMECGAMKCDGAGACN